MHGTFDKRVTLNLLAADHRRLEHAAREAGVPLAPFVRSAALAYLDQRFVVPPRLDQLLARLVQETRRVGTNLNQVAARVNTAKAADPTDLAEARRVVHQLEDTARVLGTVLHNLSPEP